MTKSRWIVPLVFAALGTGQALDSGVRLAPPHIVVLVVAALAIPTLAFALSTKPQVHGIAVIVCGALTVAARILSPVNLPELTLIAFIGCILFLFCHVLPRASRRAT